MASHQSLLTDQIRPPLYASATWIRPLVPSTSPRPGTEASGFPETSRSVLHVVDSEQVI